MTSSITNRLVIVVGDRETAERTDLTQKAADQGATIAATFGFNPGEAAAQDDLAKVPTLVAALGRAIGMRADIWVPFPWQDLGREQHIRRLSLVLQRRGLNLLLGRELAPCPTKGGFDAVDHALRTEVRAIDGLDRAAISAAGIQTLDDEIELELIAASERLPNPSSPTGVVGPSGQPGSEVSEKYFSTGQVAKFFGKSAQWVYWGLRDKVFTYPDGSLIEPERLGGNGRRRFTIAVIRDIARSCYRRGTLGEAALKEILADLDRAEAW